MRIALPIIIAVALAVYAFIDCGQTERHRVRSLTKPAWLLIILIPILGPVAWLLLGRPHAPDRPGPRSAPRPRPVAPDDDPEFLRQIRDLDEEHKQMLHEWEESLREREQRLRGDETDEDAGGNPDETAVDPADRRNGGPEIDPSDGDTR